ncbi:MAG: hypothetical protein K2Q06_16575 [Parvularculaceae bacterium]|nr:hypothetical protein [Parvularculaceae bacterium]
MTYGTLRADCVVETIDRLALRIGARFPGGGLESVCRALAEAARRCAAEAERLNRPQRLLRAGVYTVWALGGVAFLWVLTTLHYDDVRLEAASLIPVLEPAMNIAVLVGIGVLSLGRLEQNWKRSRALGYLHELRSIAHVVDMHQLTKDPARSVPNAIAPTAHSPKDPLPPALLERYLDYCSEMLSLTGKLAALFAQSCRDAEVADAASDVEALTTGLSQKIWQKMTLLERLSS